MDSSVLKLLPLNKPVFKQEVYDLLNIIYSISETLEYRKYVVRQLYSEVRRSRAKVVNRELKNKINRFYTEIHNEFFMVYQQSRKNCDDKIKSIKSFLQKHRKQLESSDIDYSFGFVDVDKCSDVFEYERELRIYEIEINIRLALDEFRLRCNEQDKNPNLKTNNKNKPRQVLKLIIKN